MAADPVVSPADTIRRDFDRLQAQVGAAVGYETSQGPLGRIWRDRAALLAVGERDRRQIAQLTEALESLATAVRNEARTTPFSINVQDGLWAADELLNAESLRAVLADEEDART